MSFGDWTLDDALRLYEQYCLSRGTTPGSDEDDELDEDDAFYEDEDFEDDGGF